MSLPTPMDQSPDTTPDTTPEPAVDMTLDTTPRATPADSLGPGALAYLLGPAREKLGVVEVLAGSGQPPTTITTTKPGSAVEVRAVTCIRYSGQVKPSTRHDQPRRPYGVARLEGEVFYMLPLRLLPLDLALLGS
jgi:hypothetical protein